MAVVVVRFAGLRAALAQMADPGARAAASQQIALEEAKELARLGVETPSKNVRRAGKCSPTLAVSIEACATNSGDGSASNEPCLPSNFMRLGHG